MFLSKEMSDKFIMPANVCPPTPIPSKFEGMYAMTLEIALLFESFKYLQHNDAARTSEVGLITNLWL
jgi:hypothetical protein